VNLRAHPGSDGFFAFEERTQRHTLALRDVAYLIRADVSVRPGVSEEAAKYRDQFRRRVARGQCFHRPYLGCREFAAEFAEATGEECPALVSEALGRMLFDLDFRLGDRNVPRFFDARLEGGVLRVPAALYEERVAA
jgi:CRISPR-associated protein Cas5d